MGGVRRGRRWEETGGEADRQPLQLDYKHKHQIEHVNRTGDVSDAPQPSFTYYCR